MKKLLLVLAGIALALLGLLWALGLSPTALSDNVTVGTAMSAKIACSGHYVSGLDKSQAAADLESYTSAASLLNVRFDDDVRATTADLWGGAVTRARFREGLGCTLEIGDTSALDQLTVPNLTPSDAMWPRGETVRVDPEIQAGLDQLLQADNEAGYQTRALLLVQDGRLVAESYAPGITAESPLLGWSMGKSLTSIMLGYLNLTGRLEVSETGLFPEWQDERATISVEHLLRMSSGLGFIEVYAPGTDATDMLFQAHSASGVAKRSLLARPPGTHFSYSSGTTNLLSELFVRRTGGSQAAIDTLWKQIFEPLGMTHSILEPDPNGIFVGSSYIYASARDWARLGQLMINGGELNGTRVVTEDWVTRSTMPNTSDNDPRYGYQFWLNGGGDTLRWSELPPDTYAMTGNRAQRVMIVPSMNAVIVRLGWTAGRYPAGRVLADALALLASSAG